MNVTIDEMMVDTRVANELVRRACEERWPAHLQCGIPFDTENGNRMTQLMVEYDDSFAFGQKLEEVINDVFHLKEEEEAL